MIKTPRRSAFFETSSQFEDLLSGRLERSANAADREIQDVWKELMTVIKRGGTVPVVYHAVLNLLNKIPNKVATTLFGDFSDIAKKTHDDTIVTLNKHLPISIKKTGKVSEAKKTKVNGAGKEKKKLAMVIPGPTQDEIAKAIYGGNWVARLATVTKLAAPEAIASVVATGVVAGKTPAEIARAIQPVVQNVKTSARRIARTEGLRIAHTIQQNAYDALGDMIVGYTIHAVKDRATREEHYRRDGTEYYKSPRAGQKSMAECPNPPMEADGSYAFNCRCWRTPIFGDL